MRIIDSSNNYMLELLSQPIKEYLLNRKDTMQWIITAIINEEDVNMIEDMSKAYVKNIQSKDYVFKSANKIFLLFLFFTVLAMLSTFKIL